MAEAKRSIGKYTDDMVCADDSDFCTDVRKAKADGLPINELTELFERLLEVDGKLETQLNEQIKAAEESIAVLDKQIEAAKAYRQTQKALDEQSEQERTQAAGWEAAKTTLVGAEAAKKEVLPELTQRLGKLRNQLSSYDELDDKIKALHDEKTLLEQENQNLSRAERQIAALAEELSAHKEEKAKLENSDAEKIALDHQLQQCSNRRNSLKNLISDYKNLHTEQKTLQKKQTAYLALAQAADEQLQAYTRMQRAFLDAQASILAGSLQAGIPCPVCSSVEHPRPAVLSEHAPTEEQVKCAKTAYDDAQAAASAASESAAAQKAKVEEKADALRRALETLLPGLSEEQAESAAQEQLQIAETQIGELNAQIETAKQNIRRKENLDKQIPKTEDALRAAQDTWNKADKQIGMLQTQQHALAARIAELRQVLTCKDKASAEQEIGVLETRADALEQALTDAQTKEKSSLNTLTATRAAIRQLREQLKTGADADLDKLSAKLHIQRGQKDALDEQRQSVHTRLAVNGRAHDKIIKQRDALDALEQKFTWMDVLARTAAGTLSGKAKIDLETYVQATYFDHILSRANLRLQNMSGGQYDLKRRRNADNKQSRSGLDLDIVDHINATERSVNTLSGGEAFLASLSLALGLSDEVQMSTGIHLDTLFVDEGFGSLDSSTLGKAHQTLAGLTEGKRLVGIISHVSELKERIDRQIVVSKGPDGSSHAELIV